MLNEIPATLIEAVKYFSNLENCNDFMREIKWPGGKIVCPMCENDSCSPVKGRPALQCNSCRKQFSYKTGTIFEDSPLGLDKWFVAVWFVANCKNGISSHELGRALGVTQKTAWFMTHRVRKAMETESFSKLAGEVESDETFIGDDRAGVSLERSRGQRRDAVLVGTAWRLGKTSDLPPTGRNWRQRIHGN